MQKCDHVWVMSNGTFASNGTYAELNSKGDLNNFLV
jgi:ABC-type transport system involved in cytochrome bd biosynthesis fused ATPase/permease subunit